MRRGALTLAAVALLAGAPPARADVAQRVSTKPATKAFAFLAEYYRLPPAERSHFTLAYRLQEKDETTPARVTLVDGAAQTPLPTSPDGWFTRLPSADALARGAQVRAEVPASAKPGMAMIPEVVLHGGIEIDAADLRTASAQITAASRRVAGPVSFVFPRFNRVLFSGGEGAAAIDAQGRATPLPLWRGTPMLDLTKADGVKAVRFARAPYHALLAPPAK